jgi:hypothetical protein
VLRFLRKPNCSWPSIWFCSQMVVMDSHILTVSNLSKLDGTVIGR